MTSQERLRKADYCVLPVSQETCRRLVRQYHYARTCSHTSTYRHGLFAREALLECLGVAQWIPPTIQAAQASWAGEWRQVLALSRLAIAPHVPANAATFLLAASVRLIARDGRWRCLVTYADTWRGHEGRIYKAANWQDMGLGEATPRWIEERSGRLVSDYTGGRHQSVSELEARGCICVGRYSTHKYRLILPPARAPRTLFDRLRGPPESVPVEGSPRARPVSQQQEE